MIENEEAIEPEAPEIEVEDDGAMSFEEAMRAAVGEPEADDTTEATEKPAEAVQDGEAPAVAAEAAPATEAVETPPEESKSLARIMERESALQAKQDAYNAAQDDINELRARLDSYEGAQASFGQDPISYIKAMAPDIDLKRLAEGLWNENLGEKAPAPYLQQKAATVHQTEQGRRLARLEQAETERQQRMQQEEAQRGVHQYLGSLQTYASNTTAESLPLVTMMQAKDPQMVAASMENIARGHASKTNGQVLTPEQVGAELEKQLNYYQLQAEPAKAAVPEPATGTSLRNSSTQTQPDRAADDELSDEYLRAKAMEAVQAVRQ
jgi:hypothetical protein